VLSGVEDPDCQRVREDRRSRRDGQAERRAEDAGERSETKQTREPGILDEVSEITAQRWQSGYVWLCQRYPRHAGRRIGGLVSSIAIAPRYGVQGCL